ncbi:hypothetical protein [Yoonia sp.]|uniref:hypothetical protein n=1 Tax=Yoonia sp. TaxID=2212373 RepID=UPI002FD8DE96
MSKLYVMIAAAAMAASPLFAQSADIDLNGDGMYSYPELMAVMPELTEEDFAELDTSGDGLLDAEEIAAGVSAGILPR